MSETANQIKKLINATPGRVWVPTDFAHLGSRDAIDKTLQRLVLGGDLRRIDRGLYDRPAINGLTKRPTASDYRAVVEAMARRDQTRLLIDGMTAANDLGLTDAVPARVTIYSDTRRRSIRVDNLLVEFKLTAPSRLYWAGRPAMRIVQALRWLKDMLPYDGEKIRKTLARLLADPKHGPAATAISPKVSVSCRLGCRTFFEQSLVSIQWKARICQPDLTRRRVVAALLKHTWGQW